MTMLTFCGYLGDGELEVKELMDNIDVINWHCFYGKELMREFSKIDTDGDGVIRYIPITDKSFAYSCDL